MTVEVKICGLSTPEARDAALVGGARWLGFVFYPKSPRSVSPQLARALTATLPTGVESVAVLVNPDDALIDEVRAVMAPGLLQLHGSETPKRVAEVKQRTGLGVIKAISVSDADSLALARNFEPVADALLFDAKAPAAQADALPGGNGLAFDWQLLKAWAGRLPWFLSGGLTAQSLARAVHETGARRLDVSSGIEDAPGRKNPSLIKQFLEEARAAEAAPHESSLNRVVG